MENHVHLVAIPRYQWSFSRGFGEAHRKYTNLINIRENWKGYLWQGRFISYPMDETHLYFALRYVEQNPVRAGVAMRAEEYPWSSAKAHVYQTKDVLVSPCEKLSVITDWASFLGEASRESEIALIRDHESSGRPLGDEKFINDLEEKTGRILRLRKRGRKKGN
jgi:putative transposase